METLIELYVNERFDNLAAALTFAPRRVVYLCSGFIPDRETRLGLTRAVKNANESCEVRFTDVGSRSLSSLFRKVGETVGEYPDSVIDMTGGPSGLLIAAHRYCVRNRFKSLFYDDKRGRFINVYGCAAEISKARLPALNIRSLIDMGGGLVTGTGHSIANFKTDEQAARGVIDLYINHLSDWNGFSEYLQFACKSFYDARTGLLMAPMTLLNGHSLLVCSRRLVHGLEQAGALTEVASDGENITFRFRSAFIKELLTTVGMCLELTVYTAAMDHGDYDDVAMSVVFDWDGVIHGSFNDTTNEIDVVASKGLSSVFVSCKSARPDTRDLYEISYLAKRFGGRKAAVVLATAYDLSKEAWAIYLRARDMGITVIEKSDIEKGTEHIADMLSEPRWLVERPD